MTQLWELMLVIFRTLPVMFMDSRYLIVIALVFMLVFSQYKRVHTIEKQMFGLHRGTPWIDTLNSLSYGLIGGLAATIIFVLVGISLSDTGIVYLWMTALALMLIHPRFLCFSYAAGLIGLSNLVFGFPQLDITAILALVAILHLVEALLISIHGYQKATPLYIKQGGRVVGGFSMQKYWPLPFIALLGIVMRESMLGFDMISMPDWWPLLQPDQAVPSGHALVYITFPVLAALGYSDLAVSSLPKQKARRSAAHLLAFSLVLLFLALAADRYPVLTLAAVLFSPLGHEWVISQGRRQEQEQSPVFTCDDGIMVLDVYPDSPAAKAGLKTADVIVQVNDVPLHSPRDLLEQMTPWMIDPVFVVRNPLDNDRQRRVQVKGKVPPLGIIPVPDPHQPVYVQMREGNLSTWLKRLFGKRRAR